MKGKFKCKICEKKRLDKHGDVLKKNTRLSGSGLDGWTTANCTIEFLYQRVSGPKSVKEKKAGELGFKLIIRAWS